MRFGFFVGFLIGAAIASVLGKSQREEASSPGEAVRQVTEGTGAKGPLDELKSRVEEAKAAAKEAAEEKEAELLRRYNEATKTD